jgi:C4-dicarboxylate transporter DctM subunit
MIAILFLTFGVFLALGMPIVFGIGAASLVALLVNGQIPFSILITKIFGGMDSFPLMAIPFFVLAGEIMNRSGITERIVEFSNDLVGYLRGGLAHVNIVANMILAGVSGSCVADCSATGTLLIPAMVKKGYPVEFSVCLTACASTMGPIIPPSILMILYGSMTGVSIGALFLGGVIPGVLIGLSLMILTVILCRRGGFGAPMEGGSLRHLKVSFRRAVWALLVPVIILGGILSGAFTATEAGIVAVVYSLIVGLFVLRTLKPNQLLGILVDSTVTAGMVMLIIGVASVFGYLLTRWHFQDIILSFLQSLSRQPGVIVAEIMVFLIVLGGFVDVTPMLIMFGPALAGIGAKLGYDPVHFGVVMVLTALIGAVTPPVATLLFVSCGIAKIPLSRIFWPVWIFVLPLVGVAFLIAHVPPLVTAIPRMLMR